MAYLYNLNLLHLDFKSGINFYHVNQLLAQKQKDSLKYLTNAIEGKDE